MSTTIDERIVSMQFDNRHFETNVSATMSTLDKLKAKLNLSGASKGLENVSSAVKKVDMSNVARGIETVSSKFSALEVMGVTALANITNQAVNAGKRIVSALTIDPIKTGFNEYETKINSIQTIMSNTASKGTTIEDVTRVIDELNTYADKTIYNFTEMTRNIGTFTAAGVGLEESAAAIQGIANLAAASGSTSQQASTAMYQLSQALASGTVKLMDWNSVVNAGMGGELFQNALKETAKVHGVAVDDIIKKNGSFRDSLHEGWLSAEILTETLQKMTKGGVAEYLSKLTGVSQDQITATQKLVEENKSGKESYDELAETLAKTGKVTKEQAIEMLKGADNAEDAATKVKTFTQLWDTLKESVQSGWGKTWELIFGDFYKARDLFTGLSDFFGGFINKMSDTRNSILEIAMDSPFAKIAEKVNEVSKATEKVVKVTKDYEAIVKKVIGGEYGKGEARWSKLAEEGYDWAKVQNMVNEQLGSSVRHTEQLSEAQGKTNETQATTIDQLVKMNDEQLKNLGLNDEEIKSLRELDKTAQKAGYSLSEVLANPELLNGRNLLINGFKNIGKAIGAIITPAKEAWVAIFPPKTTEERAQQLHGLIAAFHGLTTKLIISDKDADKLQRTFKGLFALLDIITTLIGGPLKIGFKILTSILGAFDLNILDVTAAMGDGLVAFNEWLNGANLMGKGIKFVITQFKRAKTAITDFIKGVKDGSITPEMVANAIVKGLTTGVKAVRKLFGKLGDFIAEKTGSIPGDLLAGLGNGILDGLGFIGDVIIQLGSTLVDKIKEFLGIHSPSTVFMAIGGFIVAGLILGLQNGAPNVWEAIKGIGTTLVDTLKDMNLDDIMKILGSTALIMIVKKLADAFTILSNPIVAISEVMNGAANVLNSFSGALKSFSFGIKAAGIKNIAISLAILVGAVIALTFIPKEDLNKAILALLKITGVFALLVVVVEAVSIAASKWGSGQMQFGKLSAMLFSLGASLLLLTLVVKLVGIMNPEQSERGFKGLYGMMLALGLFVGAFGLLVHNNAAKNIGNLGKMLTKLSFSLLLMVGVVKLASLLDEDEMKRGGLFVVAFGVFVIALTRLIDGNKTENIDKVGSMVLKISFAMMLMVGVVKLAGMLTIDEMKTGAIFAVGFAAFVGILCAAINGNTNLPKLGGLLMSISVSMLILVSVMKLVSMLSLAEIGKGVGFIAGFLVFVGLLVKILDHKRIPKVAAILLAMSVSIAILAGISVLLSMLKPEDVWPGVGVVAVLAVIMGGLIAVTHLAKDCKAELVVLTVAIGILAATIGILSFIDPKALKGPTIAMASLMFLFTTMIAVTKLANAGSLGVLITLTAVVTALAVIIYKLSELKPEDAASAALALSTVLVAMVGAMAILKMVGGLSGTAMASLLVMSGVMLILAGVLVILSSLNLESALTMMKSLSLVLLAFTGALVLLSVVGFLGPAVWSGLAALTTLIVGIGGILLIVGGLANMFPAAMESLDTAIVVCEKIGYAIGAIIGGFGAGLTAGFPEIATNLSGFAENLKPFIAIIESIDEGAITGAKSLAEMILAITGAQIVQGIGSLLGADMSLGSFSQQLIPFGQDMVAFSNIISGNIDESAVTAAASAGTMMAEMAKTLPGTGGLIQWVMGEKNLADFGTQLIPFGMAMVNFSSTVAGKIDEAAVTAAANAGKTMTELADTIPNTGGLLAFLAGDNTMDDFGAQLVCFGSAMVLFSKTVAGNIDESAVQAAADAGGILVSLADSIPNTGGLMGFLFGDNSMSDFGTQIVDFGTALVNFSKSVSGVDVDAIGPAVEAGKKLVELSEAIPEGDGVLASIANAFTGTDSEQFADACSALGMGVSEFAYQVAGINVSAVAAGVSALQSLIGIANEGGTIGLIFDDEKDGERFATELNYLGWAINCFATQVSGINEVTVKRGATAGKYVADMVSCIKTMGGFLNPFGEGADMGIFGQQLVLFGRYMTSFGEMVLTMNTDAIQNGVMAGKMIIDMANDLPTNGGRISDIFGESVDMATFGGQLISFGHAIKGFAINVSGIETGGVESAVTAGKAIISMANAMKNTGGLSGLLLGDADMGSFSAQIVRFGEAIKMFSIHTMGVDTLSVINATIAGKAMLSLSRIAPGKAKLAETGSQLIAFGQAIKIFSINVADINLEAMIRCVDAIQDVSIKLEELSSHSVKGFINTFIHSKMDVGNAVNGMIQAALKPLRDKRDAFAKSGEYLMKAFIGAVKLKIAVVKDTFKSVVKGAIDSVRSKTMYTNFYNAGSYLVDGFVEGIDENDYKVAAAAAAMAKAAKQAAEEALGIESPSKVFYKIGDFVSQGFTKALGDSTSRVSQASSDLANSATNGFNITLDKIQDFFDGKVDVQPVISPVLDLSNVESGAGTLNGMLNLSPSARVRANIAAINTSMNSRIQNGGNDDIISALKDLGSSLGNRSGDTYNVNGVTYDDGSNIADAVQALVRAARVERRK